MKTLNILFLALFCLAVIYAVLVYTGVLSTEPAAQPTETTDTTDLPNTDAAFSTYTFVCPQGETFSVTYRDDSDEATLLIEGDMAFQLMRSVSASGARYTDAEERVVFWEHQGEASVTMQGETRYEGCVLSE